MKFSIAVVLALALGVESFTPIFSRPAARTVAKAGTTTAPALEKILATVILFYTMFMFSHKRPLDVFIRWLDVC